MRAKSVFAFFGRRNRTEKLLYELLVGPRDQRDGRVKVQIRRGSVLAPADRTGVKSDSEVSPLRTQMLHRSYKDLVEVDEDHGAPNVGRSV